MSTKVAIFFDMECLNQSAIARFSQETFCAYPEGFHVFTKFSSSLKAVEVLEKIKKTSYIFDSDQYEELDEHFNYAANIFVLGDSAYNLSTLEAAIRLYKNKNRNYLYFHDGLYTNLIYLWVTKHRYIWKDFVQFYYPHIDELSGLSEVDLLKINIRMIKPVIELTGCSRIIVNSDNCIALIKNEVSSTDLQITKAYLPIPDYRNVIPSPRDNKDSLMIAHFGIPGELKQINFLIKTIHFLRQRHDVKLLLAGYGVEAYTKKLPPHYQEFILFEESPTTNKMLSLMKSVDIAVQLRWPITGQASGIVSEMLGLGLRCITTKGFVNECFKNHVIELPHSASVEELAQTIMDNYGKVHIPPTEHVKLLDRFSYLASAKLLFHETTKKSSEENPGY